jgi:lipopolysaccharide export system protein LptA
VQQEQQLATFTGNVEAVQGEMTLRADVLRVFYTQRREDGSAGSAGAAPAIGGQNAIRRIEAEGHVFLSSPRETAQGDAGTYDVAAAKVTLEGNVVLTQNENVVKGASLDMDLTTGVSTVRSAPGAPRGERVRARFVPARGS